MNEESREALARKMGETFLRTQGGEHLTDGEQRSFTKFGIYNDGHGHEEFISIHMTADDAQPGVAKAPFDELDDDDFIMDKPMRFDFETNSWEERAGLMKMISSPSFSFMEQDAFFNELLSAISHHKHHHTDDEPMPNGDGADTMDHG